MDKGHIVNSTENSNLILKITLNFKLYRLDPYETWRYYSEQEWRIDVSNHY